MPPGNEGSGAKREREVKMATIAEQNAILSTVKSWPERIRAFYNDVRTETRKVTAPTLKEVRATTTVVVITVFIFGLYFWVIDNVIQYGVKHLYGAFQ